MFPAGNKIIAELLMASHEKINKLKKTNKTEIESNSFLVRYYQISGLEIFVRSSF